MKVKSACRGSQYCNFENPHAGSTGSFHSDLNSDIYTALCTCLETAIADSGVSKPLTYCSLIVPTYQEQSVKLQAALDIHSLPEVPAYCGQQPSYEAARRISVYAHKLSYTTFAPETVLGQNLFRPPAPQDWDFRASALHNLSGTTVSSSCLCMFCRVRRMLLIVLRVHHGCESSPPQDIMMTSSKFSNLLL